MFVVTTSDKVRTLLGFGDPLLQGPSLVTRSHHHRVSSSRWYCYAHLLGYQNVELLDPSRLARVLYSYMCFLTFGINNRLS